MRRRGCSMRFAFGSTHPTLLERVTRAKDAVRCWATEGRLVVGRMRPDAFIHEGVDNSGD